VSLLNTPDYVAFKKYIFSTFLFLHLFIYFTGFMIGCSAVLLYISSLSALLSGASYKRLKANDLLWNTSLFHEKRHGGFPTFGVRLLFLFLLRNLFVHM